MSQHKVPRSLDYPDWETMYYREWRGRLRKVRRARQRAERDGKVFKGADPAFPEECEGLFAPNASFDESSSSGEESDDDLEPVFGHWRAVVFGEDFPSTVDADEKLHEKFSKEFVNVLSQECAAGGVFSEVSKKNGLDERVVSGYVKVTPHPYDLSDSDSEQLDELDKTSRCDENASFDMRKSSGSVHLNSAEKAEVKALLAAARDCLSVEGGSFSDAPLKPPPFDKKACVPTLMRGLAARQLSERESLGKLKNSVRFLFNHGLFAPTLRIADKKFFTAKLTPSSALDPHDASLQKQFFLHGGEDSEVVTFRDVMAPVIPLSSDGLKRLLLLNRQISEFGKEVSGDGESVKLPEPFMLEEKIVSPSGNFGSVFLQFDFFKPQGNPVCTFVFKHWKNPPGKRPMTFADRDLKEIKLSFVPNSLEFLMHDLFPLLSEWQDMIGSKGRELMTRFEVPSSAGAPDSSPPNVSFEFGIRDLEAADASK